MSTTLLAHLRSIGVVLSIDGDGKLAFDAPANVLTDELLAKMRAHRDGLWALVEKERAYLEPITGVKCPWCRSDAYLVEHGSGLRCDNCGRETWRFEDGGAAVRCDWIEPSVVEAQIMPSCDRVAQPTTSERAKNGQAELVFR